MSGEDYEVCHYSLKKTTEQVNRLKEDEITETMRGFLALFSKALAEGNAEELAEAYQSYNQLCAGEYASSALPQPGVAVQHFDERAKELSRLLYTELFFRHVYARLAPEPITPHQSFRNYVALFAAIKAAADDEKFQGVGSLPHHWLWDLVSEFIYQYDLYARSVKRPDVSKCDPALIAPRVWSTTVVIRSLRDLVDVETEKEDNIHTLATYAYVGLARVYCLLGNYSRTLDIIHELNLDLTASFSQLPCYINIYYNLAFSQIMLHHFHDAIKSLTDIIAQIGRTRHTLLGFQADDIAKKTDQFYALLAIASAFCPTHIDEKVHSTLREKHGDKIAAIQTGNLRPIEELFFFACPRFVYPDGTSEFCKEPTKTQLSLFVRSFEDEKIFSDIRGYLRLYTSVPLKKLADFLKKSEDETRVLLMAYRNRRRTFSWQGAASEDGDDRAMDLWLAQSDLDFYLDDNMIHLRENRPPHKFAEIFANRLKI